jgi:hypothetical protein
LSSLGSSKWRDTLRRALLDDPKSTKMAVELVVVLLCGGWLASFPWGREIRAQTQHTHIHDDDEARYGKIETEKLKIAIRNFPSQRQRKMKRKEKSTVGG